jgi:ATP phosphoribosyltransferase regulatory subunit
MIDIQQSVKIKNTLAKNGGDWVDLPLLLPSSTVLELAGEGLRPRLYFANSPDGEELCLRADLTMPAAVTFIASGAKEATYLCSGKVFRAQKESSINPEFRQIGIERYGDNDKEDADFAIFSSIYETCKTIGLTGGRLVLSDGGLVKKILENANLPEVWREYFLPQANVVSELLKRIELATIKSDEEPSAIEKSLLAIENDKEAANLVEEILEISKLKQGLARDTLDIAKRLRQKAKRQTAQPLSKDTAAILQEFMQIKGAPHAVLEKVKSLGAKVGIDFTDWVNEWEVKLSKIQSLIDSDTDVVFDVAMPKRFEYYDGIRFEIYTNDNDKSLASGGRYDGLISELTKGAKNIAAVGAVIRPEVILGGE